MNPDRVAHRFEVTCRRSTRRPSLRSWLVISFVSCLVLTPVVADVEVEVRNLYEWSAVAPVVVAGTSLGEDGKHFDFKIQECLRGGLHSGDEIRIDVRTANRTRDRTLYPKALRLDVGVDYVLLLEVVKGRKAKDPVLYGLERGLAGARELPLEGRDAVLDALRTFIKIQEADGEELRWHLLSQELDTNNPLVLGTAIDLYIKFRRGDGELVLGLLPLLDHPRTELRASTARLIGLIVDRHWESGTIPDDEALRAELVSRATRDDAIEVRVAATKALANFPPELVDEVLDQIAESDPEQQVRYTAELIRLEHRRAENKRND
jgi:hypothetical protein